MRDGAVGVGSFDVEAQGGAVRGVADAALQAAVGFHFGVAYLELSASRWSAVFKAFWWASVSRLPAFICCFFITV